MNSNSKVIATAADILTLVKQLEGQARIALDTEFIRESTFFPIIALIQVGTDKESWLVDPLALKPEELKPLFDVFRDPKVLKVFHAAQADQECLYTNYGVVAGPCFDTAVGASLCGLGDSIGLAKLTKEILGVQLQKGHARTDWTVRPIPEQLMRYAHQDVHHLLPITAKLFSQLEKSGRKEWALELSARFADSKMYEPNPNGIALKLAKNGKLDRRGFATLRELIAWREARVRELDLPRRRVAEDDVLVDLALVRPKDMTHLSAFRGLNRGEFKHSGEAILAAVKRAAQIPDAELPEVPKVEQPDPKEARAIELIQCFVKLLSEELQISARHLMVADDVVPLLRKRFSSVDELVNAGILSAGAGRLIGAELLEMVNGKRGLSVSSGTVRIAKL